MKLHFLRLPLMTVVPLVFASITLGVASFEAGHCRFRAAGAGHGGGAPGINERVAGGSYHPMEPQNFAPAENPLHVPGAPA